MRLDEHSNHRNVQNQAVHCYNNMQSVHLANYLSPHVPRCPKVCTAQPVGHTGIPNSWNELQPESAPPAFQILHASHCSQTSISLPVCQTPNSLFNAQAQVALPVCQTMNMPYNFFDQTELTAQKSVETSYRKQVHSVPAFFEQTRSTPHRAQVQTTLPFQQTSYVLSTSAATASNQIIDTSLNFRLQNAVPGFQTSSTSTTEIVWQSQATPLAYRNINFPDSRQIQSAPYNSQMKNSLSDVGAQMLGTNHFLLGDNRNLNALAFHVENKGYISPSNPFNSNRSSTDKLFGANIPPEFRGNFQFPASYQLNPIAPISSQHYQPTSIYYTHSHQQAKDYWVQKEQFLDQRNVETGNAFPIHQSQQQQIYVTSSNVVNSPHRLDQHAHSVAQSNTFDSNNRHLPHYLAYLKQNVSSNDQAIFSEFSRRQHQKSANRNKQSLSKQTRVCQDKTLQPLAEVQNECRDSNDQRDDSCETNVTYNIYCGNVDKSSKKTVFGDHTQIGGTHPTSKNYCIQA